MLAACYVVLRFCHFTALLLILGCAICGALLAPGDFRRVIMRRLSPVWLPAAMVSLGAALLLWAVQGGMMGNGWADAFSPGVWGRLLDSHFGSIWLWQIIFAAAVLMAALIKPRGLSALLLVLCTAQVVLLGSTGHGALHTGLAGVISQLSHALHLLAAGWWAGGLIPLLVCMALARRARWQRPATLAMMRFSRYGHLAVALVIISGAVNMLLITGLHWPEGSAYLRALSIKVGLVFMMAILALVNRYLLVPRFEQSDTAQRWFITFTRAEMLLSLAVVGLVSLFATWDPF
ncbi:copper homeostasis membrane protein CopD [Shimwellia blattae]|uniref:Copper resistance protein D n=1 Tax=Shimwellia blattae (strain ATCC 29907 / DSM 4481 / JCM 1650 / NBRC 105725 / CDC 9005-74) TaxID=630626 RepID=I2B8G4_SHIBC|nr:copper homeostasis membrane protein CopD [Shimwellia blattae]AFJ46818.1 copper resistance D domain protein [Shimwellia blattae DSM 4481 = NBRC 105725]GAB82958.1 hypothetical protein YebZ [Shimwellia blattae DSM 4481 = NBRC 105725]VDY64297.1 Inner membrane protein YebZ [Shimwellia blattae]VEC22422.1 Inner membrane protein YebZ [Shimwellia blattae]